MSRIQFIAAKDVRVGDELFNGAQKKHAKYGVIWKPRDKRFPWSRVTAVNALPITLVVEGGQQIKTSGFEIVTQAWSTILHAQEGVGIKERENPRYRCQNCDVLWLKSELHEVEDLAERVSPGERVPDGQCPDPDCKAVCHLEGS